MPYTHFKMITIVSVSKLVNRNCKISKIYIKNAYYSLPIHEKGKYI